MAMESRLDDEAGRPELRPQMNFAHMRWQLIEVCN